MLDESLMGGVEVWQSPWSHGPQTSLESCAPCSDCCFIILFACRTLSLCCANVRHQLLRPAVAMWCRRCWLGPAAVLEQCTRYF
jgi:hypothetical protein